MINMNLIFVIDWLLLIFCFDNYLKNVYKIKFCVLCYNKVVKL